MPQGDTGFDSGHDASPLRHLLQKRGVRRLLLAMAVATGFFLSTATAVAATPATRLGIITGQLGYEGGAYPGGFRPSPGVIKFVGPQKVRPVKVPTSGDFTVHVVPGHYTLTGCSGTRNRQCGTPQPVTAKAHTTSHVQVVWLRAP
jgi:hypothetical protein